MWEVFNSSKSHLVIDILDNFSYISGLKFNVKKYITKSNVVYLKDRKQWSSTGASSLSMNFCTYKENIFRANLIF